MGGEWADKDRMWWLASAVVVGGLTLCGLGWAWKRRRDWVAGLDRLAESPPGDGPVDPRGSAEGHFLRGCAVLEARRPAAAVRHFQLAHHGDHAYELAAILSFTCMKMGAEDMPQLLRIVDQTIRETSRSRIPSCSREKEFLAWLARLSEPLPEGLSAYGAMLWRLPILPLRQQLLAAQEGRFEWAGALFAERKAGPRAATSPA
jgi:hypothetical protein